MTPNLPAAACTPGIEPLPLRGHSPSGARAQDRRRIVLKANRSQPPRSIAAETCQEERGGTVSTGVGAVMHSLCLTDQLLSPQNPTRSMLLLSLFCGCYCSVTKSCLTLCNPMDCSTPGFPVHHQLPELTLTHVHQVGIAIQPSHPLLSPSPPAFNLSHHQGLFQ